jgi:hypothetical protein
VPSRNSASRFFCAIDPAVISTSLDSGDPMSVLSWLAGTGLFSLALGFLVVNVALSPRAAQTGMGLAAAGFLMLAAFAVWHLLV